MKSSSDQPNHEYDGASCEASSDGGCLRGLSYILFFPPPQFPASCFVNKHYVQYKALMLAFPVRGVTTLISPSNVFTPLAVTLSRF